MHTVNDMLDKYVRENMSKLSKRTGGDYGRHVKHLRDQFGNRDVRSITHQEIVDYVGPVAKGYVQKLRKLAVLRSAYNYAIKWGGWVDGNPCTHVGRGQPRKREPLTMQQFEQAVKLISKTKAGEKAALVMQLALHTGQLQGGITGLQWSHIDREAGTILFRETRKQKRKTTVVLITPEIEKLLGRAKELCSNSVYVVTTNRDMAYTSEGFRALWQRFLEKWENTGRDRILFHDIKILSKKISADQKLALAVDPIDDFPQLGPGVIAEAEGNAPYYRVFFCLERIIRQQVADTLEKAAGVHWWDSDKITPDIQRYVSDLITKEWDNATQRSPREIDYTTFGQLGQIITKNWDLFESQFKSTNKQGITNIMFRLNMARGPIAHCCPLSPLEIERLLLTVRNWFDIVVA
jgi:site-specific recombinase XerD